MSNGDTRPANNDAVLLPNGLTKLNNSKRALSAPGGRLTAPWGQLDVLQALETC